MNKSINERLKITVIGCGQAGNSITGVCQVKCVSSFLHLFPQPSAV